MNSLTGCNCFILMQQILMIADSGYYKQKAAEQFVLRLFVITFLLSLPVKGALLRL